MMQENRLPVEISFERWLQHVFDHPVGDEWWPSVEGGDWWWADDAEIWDGEENCAIALAFMTRLFEDPGFLLDSYTPMQIDRGVNYMISNCCSNHCFAFTDPSTPIGDRVRCISAISTLFEQVMAPIYGDYLGAGSSLSDPDTPTFSCYMFWDVCPIYSRQLPASEEPLILEAVVGVLERTLKLKSEACKESALHGLGHLHLSHPELVAGIVGRYLAVVDNMSESLRRYAESAKEGNVL